jgi:hypothetical protein
MHLTGRAAVAILCAGLGALFFSFSAEAQPNYLVPLPQKGTVIAVNNNGQVLYDTGLVTGNVFAAFPAGFTAPTGSPGILGEGGAVAGKTATGHLALYSAGAVTDLGVPPWQFDFVTPTAINASGQIVGSTLPIPTSSAFLYSGGVFNPINLANTGLQSVSPTDLNDSGQILVCGPTPVETGARVPHHRFGPHGSWGDLPIRHQRKRPDYRR